jgi:ribosomal protein S18 acetylase RimI-like enzyme
MLIKELLKSDYEGYQLHFTYQSNFYYDIIINQDEHSFEVRYQKKQFEEAVTKMFDSKMFEPYNSSPKAYGLFDEDILAGVVEINHEDWNKRIRITELLVFEEYRKKGYGHQLMKVVKDYFFQTDYRAIVLETQSCNDPAISFYLKEGFFLIGHDLICYTNHDIDAKEVRLEFAFVKTVYHKKEGESV